MNVSEYMKKHGLTDGALDAMAAPYESGEYQHEEGAVFSGSHFDARGKCQISSHNANKSGL